MSGRAACWGVCALFLGLYLLLGGTGFYSTDGETMLRTTWAIVDRGRLSVPCDAGQPSAVPGRDGRCYSRYGLGQPLAAIPLYLLGKVAAIAPGADYGESIRFAVPRLNAIVTALSCGLVCLIGAVMSGSWREGASLSALFGLGTLALPYSRFYFNEPLTTLGLLAAMYALFRYSRTGAARWATLAGLGFGCAVLTRTTAAVLLPVLLVYLWLDDAPVDARFRATWTFLLPVVVLAGVQMAYQIWAFGDPLVGGYEGESWGTPLLQGLHGLFLSSGKSVFLFVPLALLFPWGLAALNGSGRRREALLFGLATVVWLLVHAGWWTWHGGWSWGPRFLLPLVPLWVLALDPLWKRGSVPRALIIGLAGIGLLVNLGGVFVNFGDYMMAINDEDKVLFNPSFSPVWGHWRVLLEGGRPDLVILSLSPTAAAAWAALCTALMAVGAVLLRRGLRSSTPLDQPMATWRAGGQGANG